MSTSQGSSYICLEVCLFFFPRTHRLGEGTPCFEGLCWNNSDAPEFGDPLNPPRIKQLQIDHLMSIHSGIVVQYGHQMMEVQ